MKIDIFDTTLRDGFQQEGISPSVKDKLAIAKLLDDLGVDYIEGGWPGANPSDTEFFQKGLDLKNSTFTAFGMTKKAGRSAENDPGLSAILNSNTKSVCLVGKSWDFHGRSQKACNDVYLPKVPFKIPFRQLPPCQGTWGNNRDQK